VLGMAVACQAGYDPDGMLILMRVFAQLDPSAGSFMKNHPSGLERFQYLQGEAQRCKSLQKQFRTSTPSQSLTETAPATFSVRMRTTKGDFVIGVTRAWAPLGADRFYNLVKAGFYSECPFDRVIPNFMVQFGNNPAPDVSQAWANAYLPDEPVTQSNLRGRVAFATVGPGTRTTQLFINLRNSPALDHQGFAPIGEIVTGMDTVENLFSGYGDQPNRAMAQGKEYLERNFPNLDWIKEAVILGDD
jgi:peptidyl-prolyl cis-trans isomerase A (cyclophilin A)